MYSYEPLDYHLPEVAKVILFPVLALSWTRSQLSYSGSPTQLFRV